MTVYGKIESDAERTMMRIATMLVTMVVMSLRVTSAGRGEEPGRLRRIAMAAVAAERESAAEAISYLRAAGPAGLDALFEAHAPLIERARQGAFIGVADDPWRRLTEAIDTVGAQRDGFAARLYWYTDMGAARHAAEASGKPILSLRLLGKLTDEYSCANSRFFRTVLYANEQVSGLLRERFVLHWQSVRPVPRVTIDFGDGRTIERTLTGNSIHYVLDKFGRPVDALPGLYGPAAFARGLRPALQAALSTAEMPAAERSEYLFNYHEEKIRFIAERWRRDLEELGISIPTPPAAAPVTAAAEVDARAVVPAGVAAFVAPTKRAVEAPIINQLTVTVAPIAIPAADVVLGNVPAAPANQSESVPRTILEEVAELEDRTDPGTWDRLSHLPSHVGDTELDEGSIALMRKQNPRCVVRGASSPGQLADANDPLRPMLEKFRRTMALDGVKNEYLLHRRIHEAIRDSQATVDVDDFNEWVYAQLFLTPTSDPWLGLMPEDTYTGLETGR
jgi:hypothetical protein